MSGYILQGIHASDVYVGQKVMLKGGRVWYEVVSVTNKETVIKRGRFTKRLSPRWILFQKVFDNVDNRF